MSDKNIDWIRRLQLLEKALKENGVNNSVCVEIEPKISGYELDFSEHDKVFEDKIAELDRMRKVWLDKAVEWQQENEKLKQRIAELESKETETCGKEPKISDSAPSREWYENRHQSDCIEINRLNTTIDVLIHKVEYLRQFAGLE